MERMREARKKMGYTMKFIAEKVGVSESAISQYETGKRQPDFETASKIADLLFVSVDYLLGRESDPADPTTSPAVSDRMKQLIQETDDLSDSEFELVRMFLKQMKKNR